MSPEEPREDRPLVPDGDGGWEDGAVRGERPGGGDSGPGGEGQGAGAGTPGPGAASTSPDAGRSARAGAAGGGPPPDPAGSVSPARLRRSRTDRVIAGVCGGLGPYLGVDPVLVRLAFVALALAGGSGVLIYLVAWLVIPAEEPGQEPAGPGQSAGVTMMARVVIGVVLVAVGASLLLQRLVPEVGEFIWPVVLVALGLVVIGTGVRR